MVKPVSRNNRTRPDPFAGVRPPVIVSDQSRVIGMPVQRSLLFEWIPVGYCAAASGLLARDGARLSSLVVFARRRRTRMTASVVSVTTSAGTWIVRISQPIAPTRFCSLPRCCLGRR